MHLHGKGEDDEQEKERNKAYQPGQPLKLVSYRYVPCVPGWKIWQSQQIC